MICAHYKCRAEFDKEWAGQIYCCTACRITERNFRKAHGEKAINAAVAGRDPLPAIADALRIMEVKP